jgi:hypothetical protein
MPRSSPTMPARWTAALLTVAALLFALAAWLEHGGEPSGGTAHVETGEGSAATEAGEAAEGKTPVAHPEPGAAAENGGQLPETVLGINLENRWLVWGFVAASLILAAVVLRLWPPAFLLTILLAGVAALLDGREVFSQLERENAPIAILALIIALAHAAAAISAAMGWRTLRTV